MRTRGPNPFPWASVGPFNPGGPLPPDLYTPVTVPWAQAIKWYHRVKIWQVVAHIEDSGGTVLVDFTGTAFWNVQNNASLPLDPGFPASEQQVAIGWEMQNFLPDPFSSFAIDFFSSTLGSLGTAGCGIQYSDPASDTFPFIFITFPGGNTSPTGTSSVTCAIDGISINIDDGGSGLTGFITMDPEEYWEDKKSNNTAAIWNFATGAQLLNPHQTDELPSSS